MILESIKKKSKQPIDLMSVNVDQIVISDKFKHNKKVLIILLVTKKMKWLNHNVLFYLKWMGTSNTLKLGVKTCLLIKNEKIWEKYEDIWHVIEN